MQILLADMDQLIYLACPYSHEDERVRVERFEAVNRVAARMMHAGLLVFSPISHTHPIAVAGELPRGWDFWEKFDKAFLSMCRAMVVLCLDGWTDSVGVQAEVRLAESLGMEVYYLPPGDEARLENTIIELAYPM